MQRPWRWAAVLLAGMALASCAGGPAALETLEREPGTTAPATVPPDTAPPEAGGEAAAATTTAVPAPVTTTTSANRDGANLVAAGPRVVASPRGVVLPVLGVEGDALRVGTPCGRTTLVTKGRPLEGSVVLDAGHGGVEPGAVGPGGLTEKQVNLAVVGHTKAALEAAGVGVVLTRTGDYRMTLEARARVVRALDTEAFVSVHHNAEPDGPRPGPGSETYYQVASAESKRLSGLIYEEVVRALARYPLTWVADTDAGAKYRRGSTGDDYYGILRRTQGTPAALAELAFISNPAEEALVARAEVQQVEGEAVARGVIRFLTTDDTGSGYTEPYPRATPAGPGGGGSDCVDPPL